MWLDLAPTAMRRPISRVRSVTLTSMMFMMPIPPTSRDTAAIDASSVVSVLVPFLLRARRHLLPSCEWRSRRPDRRLHVMPVAEEVGDLASARAGVSAPSRALT